MVLPSRTVPGTPDQCERAIGQLKAAGFLKVEQPRHRNEEDAYFGPRAIRVFTKKLFDWLGLDLMLTRERGRAAKALRRKAAKAGKSVSDLMERLRKVFKPVVKPPRKSLGVEKVRAWNHAFLEFSKLGLETREASDEPTNNSAIQPPGALAKVRPGEEDVEFQSGSDPERVCFFAISTAFLNLLSVMEQQKMSRPSVQKVSTELSAARIDPSCRPLNQEQEKEKKRSCRQTAPPWPPALGGSKAPRRRPGLISNRNRPDRNT